MIADIQGKKINKFFEQVIEEVVSLGGDTDTNACIVGNLIGTYVGI